MILLKDKCPENTTDTFSSSVRATATCKSIQTRFWPLIGYRFPWQLDTYSERYCNSTAAFSGIIKGCSSHSLCTPSAQSLTHMMLDHQWEALSQCGTTRYWREQNKIRHSPEGHHVVLLQFLEKVRLIYLPSCPGMLLLISISCAHYTYFVATN